MNRTERIKISKNKSVLEQISRFILSVKKWDTIWIRIDDFERLIKELDDKSITWWERAIILDRITVLRKVPFKFNVDKNMHDKTLYWSKWNNA